jgi:hypothetical protein
VRPLHGSDWPALDEADISGLIQIRDGNPLLYRGGRASIERYNAPGPGLMRAPGGRQAAPGALGMVSLTFPACGRLQELRR